MFLTNVGVPGGSILVAKIRKQKKKLQSISYLSAPEIPKMEKKNTTWIIGTFSKTGLKKNYKWLPIPITMEQITKNN